MKKKMTLFLVLVLAMTVFVVPTSAVTVESETLTEAEIHHLLFIREEEKLAYDVYSELYDRWGMLVFANIMKAEAKHTDAVKNLIDKYGLVDPYVDGVGNFTNLYISDLFVMLTEWGNESIEDAILVGAFIEEYDILDLLKAMEDTHKTDIDKVYNNIMEGSYNHLEAFVYQYEETLDIGEYVPKLIDVEDYNDILELVEKGSQEQRIQD